MAPFVVLVGTFLLLRVAGLAGLDYFDSWIHCLRAAVGCMLLITASAHWGRLRPDLIRMVPASLPRPDWIVTVTGILEIAGAAAIVIPAASQAASVLLIIMLLAMFPANIRAAKQKLPLGGRPATPLGFRTFLQVVFISAIWIAGNVIV